jgi:uncharacterized protein YbcI
MHATELKSPGSARGVAAESVLADVSAAVGRLFRDRWGRGPRKCRALWAGPDVLLVLVEGSRTVAEETLRAGGHEDQVLADRLTLQELIEVDLRSLVETATGRSVRTFLSAARVEPDVSAELFLLEPDAHTRGTGQEGEPTEKAHLKQRLTDAERDTAQLGLESKAVESQSRQAHRRSAEVKKHRRT